MTTCDCVVRACNNAFQMSLSRPGFTTISNGRPVSGLLAFLSFTN